MFFPPSFFDDLNYDSAISYKCPFELLQIQEEQLHNYDTTQQSSIWQNQPKDFFPVVK